MEVLFVAQGGMFRKFVVIPHLVPGTWFLVPGTWCLVPVPGAWCQVLSDWIRFDSKQNDSWNSGSTPMTASGSVRFDSRPVVALTILGGVQMDAHLPKCGPVSLIRIDSWLQSVRTDSTRTFDSCPDSVRSDSVRATDSVQFGSDCWVGSVWFGSIWCGSVWLRS